MLQKTYDAEFKALTDDTGADTGTVEAIVSVFNNVDLMGDRVMPGAFAETIKEWQDSGDPIPMVWSHNWGDPFSHIGSWDPMKAEETEKGLKLVGTIDLIDNPFAAQTYKLLKSRRVKEFSFAYDVRDEHEAKDHANELLNLELVEAGPTLKGANPDTQLLLAKALATSTIEGKLRETRDAIDALLALGSDETKAKAEPDPEPEEETTEPEVVKAPVPQELRQRLLRARLG